MKPKSLLILVSDVQKGIAVGFSMFYQTGKMKTMKIKNVPGVTEIKAFDQKFNLPAVHFMKIRKGRMSESEAIGTMLPYGVSSNWE